jgi:hypothetical protein
MEVFAAPVNSRVTLAKELPNETVFLWDTQQTHSSWAKDLVAFFQKADIVGNMFDDMVGDNAINAIRHQRKDRRISSEQRNLGTSRRGPTQPLSVEIKPGNPILGGQGLTEELRDHAIATAKV